MRIGFARLVVDEESVEIAEGAVTEEDVVVEIVVVGEVSVEASVDEDGGSKSDVKSKCIIAIELSRSIKK